MRADTQALSIPCAFGRGTPVHAYWVERCAGFAVVDADGRELGYVRRVDPDRDELVVARRLRSQRIPMAAVQSVWPRGSTIQVSGFPRRESVRLGAPASDDTLPWFDLVGADARGDEPTRSALGWMRRRSQSIRRTVGVRVGGVMQSARAHVRRFSSVLRARAAKLADESRRRCARGLIRLARMVEPRSHETR